MIGKYVVVTGGEGDVARALSQEFRDAGYHVESPGRSSLDVCDSQSISQFFDQHRCDLLICCAGATKDALLVKTNADDWDNVWQINFLGAKRCAEAALPAMLRHGMGHIVFLSSHAALHPAPGQSAYSTAKRALIGLSHDMAARYGQHNIRINVILPGFLENRMTSGIPSARKDEVLADHALARFNTMDQVTSFLRFLHESMPHTSGQWFQLDSRQSMI